MNVGQLLNELGRAIRAGLPVDTTVVVDTGDSWRVLEYTGDPTTPEHGCEVWFTLEMADEADSRSTPGGMPPCREMHDGPLRPTGDYVPIDGGVAVRIECEACGALADMSVDAVDFAATVEGR